MAGAMTGGIVLRSEAGRTIFAVLTGYLTTAVLVWATERLLAGTPKTGNYWVVDFLSQCSIQMGAGYLCAMVADPAARKRATFWLIGMGLFVRAVSLISHWRAVPHWYGVTLLAVYGPSIFAGFLCESFLNRRRP
jgi:hypothetical protein